MIWVVGNGTQTGSWAQDVHVYTFNLKSHKKVVWNISLILVFFVLFLLLQFFFCINHCTTWFYTLKKIKQKNRPTGNRLSCIIKCPHHFWLHLEFTFFFKCRLSCQYIILYILSYLLFFSSFFFGQISRPYFQPVVPDVAPVDSRHPGCLFQYSRRRKRQLH